MQKKRKKKDKKCKTQIKDSKNQKSEKILKYLMSHYQCCLHIITEVKMLRMYIEFA